MVKRIFLILLLVLVFYGLVTLFLQWCEKKSLEPPSPEVAPYVVQTPSRIYYVEEYERTEEGLILITYWETVRGRWKRQDGPLPITDQFHHVTITER